MNVKNMSDTHKCVFDMKYVIFGIRIMIVKNVSNPNKYVGGLKNVIVKNVSKFGK